MDEQTQSEYFELLRFPTVGADPLHLRDCVQCAMWLKAWLARLGFAGELMTEGGNPPFLFAERKGAEGAPTVLLYGHYDVQPPDPLDEWETPLLPPDQQNEGAVGWIIETAGITNSFVSDPEKVKFCLVRPRKIRFKKDAYQDERGRWQTFAESAGGQFFGWWGGEHDFVFSREPNWHDLERYGRMKAKKERYPDGVPIQPW